jgi:hypothetical protein
MNDLYKHEWCWFNNFWRPCFKLKEKIKVGSKYKRIYDTPKTPYQRVLENPTIPDDKKEELKALCATLLSDWPKARDSVLRTSAESVVGKRSIVGYLRGGGMSSSLSRRLSFEPLVEDVSFTKSSLVVMLSDGREFRMPLEWSERLRNATPKQRKA